MKIEMRCPNGHSLVYNDGRFSIPDSQKPDYWLSKKIKCIDCEEVWTEAYELVEVELQEVV